MCRAEGWGEQREGKMEKDFVSLEGGEALGGSQLPPGQAGWREDRALEEKGRTKSRTQGC